MSTKEDFKKQNTNVQQALTTNCIGKRKKQSWSDTSNQIKKSTIQ